MARILPQSVFRRGFDHQSWGADRRTAGSDQWLAPEGVKAAVAITDTVGGVVSSAVQKKMGRDKILDQLSMGKEISRLAREAKADKKGAKVLELQKRLLAEGEKLPRFGADGSWGSESESALIRSQDKRAKALFGKNARPEQFNQYDMAQKESGNPFSRIVAGTQSLFGADEGEYAIMQANQARAEEFEDQALARQSAAAAYRQAAGAETMEQRRDATGAAMSAWDRRRAATLSGQAAGEGQQAITQDLKRLFPGRKPQKRSGGGGRRMGLPRDVERDYRRSEANVNSGQLALAYQKGGNSFANSPGTFRQLSEREANIAGMKGTKGGVWIPASRYLSKTTNDKLRSTDRNVQAQGFREAVDEARRSEQLASNLGKRLPEEVKKQRAAHDFFSKGKSTTMYRSSDHPDVDAFFGDPLYARSIQGFGFDTTAPTDQTGGGGGSQGADRLPGNSRNNSVTGAVLEQPQGDTSFRLGGEPGPVEEVLVGPAATAEEVDNQQAVLFGGKADLEAMQGRAGPPAQPEAKPAPKAKKKPKKKAPVTRTPIQKKEARQRAARIRQGREPIPYDRRVAPSGAEVVPSDGTRGPAELEEGRAVERSSKKKLTDSQVKARKIRKWLGSPYAPAQWKRKKKNEFYKFAMANGLEEAKNKFIK